jgi:hypothetical protein
VFSLAANIYKYFGRYYKLTDSNKDNQERGTNERLNKALAEDFDETLLPLITQFVVNLVDPMTAKEEMLSYFEGEVGVRPVISDSVYIQRKLLKYASTFDQVATTLEGFEMLFNMMGINVVLTEDLAFYTLDSPKQLDDPDRKFDSSLKTRYITEITLDLEGTAEPSDELDAFIEAVIKANKAIDVRIKDWTYNQVGSGVDLDFTDPDNIIFLPPLMS